MVDLKKYVLVNDLKLEKCLERGKLRYLAFIADDAKYWQNLFSYNEEKSNLENFLLYRTAGAFNIHGYVDDGDIAPPVFDYLENKLKTIKNVKLTECKSNLENKKYYGSKRVVKVILNSDEELYLETDTANSLMYDLGDFFRKVLEKRFGKKWYKNYFKDFDLPTDKNNNWYMPFKFYYFYNLLSASFKGFDLSNEEIDCLNALEQRAQYTHTLKNMILVPFGYNRFRGNYNSRTSSGKKIKDRLDLTIIDFKDMLNEMSNDAMLQNRIKDKRGYSSLNSVKFLLDNQNILFPAIAEYTEEMEENSIEAITLRSKLISETLK